ncbi:hypothetical protein SM0020_18492 [Sinorhizobium meliloti CCNWSX0020]|uniref:Uncharacterized protein n=1 Tax=Sinorhizobium meliloti CCNWSX0020 TaxID=1107881 RepID=H0G2K8_RHIML|nr:hypothetical protein SM0020_18492 [Sinorhizobium meliloti CCNWSX0020]
MRFEISHLHATSAVKPYAGGSSFFERLIVDAEKAIAIQVTTDLPISVENLQRMKGVWR